MRSISGLLVNLAIAAAASLLCLMAGELAVRAIVPVRDVGPSFTTYDPTYGKVLKPSSSITRITPEFTMQLTTNSRGFRGPELGSVDGGSILFLGDSFTMGYGVTDGEEYPAIVRQAIADCNPPLGLEVINAGIGDNGTGRGIKFLRRDAAALKPRIVVLQIHANDFEDNVNERLFSLTDSGELVELALPPPGIDRKLQRLIDSVPGIAYSHLVGLTRQLKMPKVEIAKADTAQEAQAAAKARTAHEEHLMLRLLGEVVRITNEAKWQLLVVIADVPRPRHALLEGFFAERGVTTLSIPTKVERPDLYFKIDGHWNAIGQAYAADRVLQALWLQSNEMQSGSHIQNTCRVESENQPTKNIQKRY
jgi:lysophospholipase L1-like esterase